jgi:hypothetical protein
MAPTLTHELLDRAQSKLKEAERALQADPTNKWLKMAVHAALDKVESIQRSLHGRQEPPRPPGWGSILAGGFYEPTVSSPNRERMRLRSPPC